MRNGSEDVKMSKRIRGNGKVHQHIARLLIDA